MNERDQTAEAATHLGPAQLHHVAIPVRDATRSRAFYAEVLGLREIDRPDFSYDGAWYGLGDRHVHLLEQQEGAGTFRDHTEGINGWDVHFALRVDDYRAALRHLIGLGYHVGDLAAAREAEDVLGMPAGSIPVVPGDGDLRSMRVAPASRAGFPQIYLMDPDRNVIEINAAAL